MKKVFAIIMLLLIVGGCGTATLSEYITPADIDSAAVNYVTQAGVAEPKEYDGYPSLYKAKKLVEDVDVTYVLNTQELTQALQREETNHSIFIGTTKANYQSGLQRADALFGETGLLSMGLSIIGAGGFAGILGLMRKRPGDITPQEMQSALGDATGRTTAELSAREKQFTQVVKGVDELKNIYKEQTKTDSNATVKVADLLTAMKTVFDSNQDTDTQQAVAVAVKS